MVWFLYNLIIYCSKSISILKLDGFLFDER